MYDSSEVGDDLKTSVGWGCIGDWGISPIQEVHGVQRRKNLTRKIRKDDVKNSQNIFYSPKAFAGGKDGLHSLGYYYSLGIYQWFVHVDKVVPFFLLRII